MRKVFALLPLFVTLAFPAHADARLQVLVDLLRLDEVAVILREEGLSSAEDLNARMLDGQGGAAWDTQVDKIYDPERFAETVRGALAEEIEGEPLEQAITFFASDLGQKVVELENTARRAIQDEKIEAAARLRYADLEYIEDPRLEVIEGMAEGADMVERNVATALNSNLQFFRGLADGRAVDMTKDEILDDVTTDIDGTRADTRTWLYGYLLMAYSPLTDAELQQFADFAATPAGQALNDGLFTGSGRAYEEISYALGRAVALNMVASEL